MKTSSGIGYLINKNVLDILKDDKSVLWREEYVRIGRQYARWAAIFVIVGSPLIMISEKDILINSHQLWVFFRLFSSVVTTLALIIFFLFKNRFKYIHEFLFTATAYSLYVNSGFWAVCETDNYTFILGQLCILVPTVLITILRPILYLVNFFVHLIIIVAFFPFTCGKEIMVFITSLQFYIFLIIAVSTYLFASYRYYLMRKNFVISTLLQEALDDAEAKRQKSDELLLNILPAEVAHELKTKGESEAKQYDHVTIMFVDFVNFTGISEELSPKELVKTIHQNFTVFDRIIDKYGIEKIKTIGDAYLAVSGLPTQNPRHAQVIIQAAKEIRDYMESVDGVFQIRVGVNSGTVVAGIVGVKKFAYDIWGDAVNIAARLEQECEAGKINISHNTFELVKDEFQCQYRGKIPAKNKGEIDMYYVN